MELWELNSYIKGYKVKVKDKEKSIIKVAYYTASFNNAKKSKSLNYYLKQIDNSDNKKSTRKNNDKLEFARKMYEKIKNSCNLENNIL